MRRLLLALALAAAPLAARADALPEKPILRIETGMHGGAINALAVPPDGKSLISVSDDKTTRIWSLEDGSLLKTLRSPIGNGPEGALYALALSPSGKTIAVAGYTGIAEGGAAIYLFQRETGAPIGRIALGRADAVTVLAFAPDGSRLAAGVNDSRGVRILDLARRTVEVLDAAAGSPTTGLAYAADGRLATASQDGKVRLYDRELKRVAERNLGAAAEPFSLAFSPDGSRLAVGSLAEAKVRLLGRNLEPLSEMTGAEGTRGTLALVAWSIDGQRLYAAGTYGEAAGRKRIRRWLSFGGGPLDLPAGDDTVTALAPLSNGGIAFATAEPRWGSYDASDKPGKAHPRTQIDLRDTQRQFLVSKDGAVVEFGLVQGGGKRGRFDLNAGEFAKDAPPRADLAPPAESKARDWRNTTRPTFAGKALALDPGETARSVAASGDRLVLGTDYFVRLYDAGRLVWKTALPAPAWTVNVSGDGRWALVGTGDGTIRWLRLDNGDEALALFVEPTSGGWVVWTPEGFFDHSPGGERLIGYHLNRISDGTARGADFVRVEQLYSLFFRRDLVIRKLRGDDDAVAAELASIGDIGTILGRGLPPTVQLTEWCSRERGLENCAPVAGDQLSRSGVGKIEPIRVSSPELVVRFKVEDRGGGHGPVVLRRQGAQIEAPGATRAVTGKTREEERVVELEPGLNMISLSAFNAAKEIETSTEERANLAVIYEGVEQRQPVLRVVAIGIDRYRSPAIEPLANAAADARGIVETFGKDRTHRVFRELDAKLLIDEEATLEGITAALEQLAQRTRPEDLAVLFFAGHSVALNGKFFFLPHDLSRPSPEAIQKESLTHDRLAALLAKLPSGRAMLILDSCFSGAFAVGDSVLRDSRDETLGRQMSRVSGRFILAASSSYEEALDGEDGHGVLTGAILEGLAGAADRHLRGNRDGKVNVLEIGEWAKARVPQISARLGQTQAQRPRWYFTGDDMFDLRSADESSQR